jgi:hypothetical protein
MPLNYFMMYGQHSSLYVDMHLSMSFNFRLSKVMGPSSCKSTTTKLNPKELHSMLKG